MHDFPSRAIGIQPDDTLITLFRRTARTYPEDVGIAGRDEALTYAQLDRESDFIAESLRQRGVRPGQRIGLAARRSCASVTGLLGILKAGCAYVPLDPGLPSQRRSHIVSESSIALILDVGQAPNEWLQEADTDAVGLTECGGMARQERQGQDELTGSCPAYVIYTSGSTGAPKGCEVTHRSVVALLRNALPLFKISNADAWTVTHSLAFDFSVWELWGAFATGGKAVMVDDATVIDPTALGDLLDKQSVTIVNMVPSAFATLLAVMRWRPVTVRLIIFGGEPVQLNVVRRFLEEGEWSSASRPQVLNMYGITETTVLSTFQVIGPEILSDPEGRCPIGEPLPHVDLKLFTQPGVVATDGEVGEIYIGGDSVAVGYVGRAGLTAERFVTLANSDGKAGRYYRSGDLARRGKRGLEYCGRIDHQVKLRGFRVELEEVEGAIEALPYIGTAAVTLESSKRGLPLLVAFVVPLLAGQDGYLRASVRRDLRLKLPQYMIPSHVVPLPAVPMTTSGKRDRAHLSGIWRDQQDAADRLSGGI